MEMENGCLVQNHLARCPARTAPVPVLVRAMARLLRDRLQSTLQLVAVRTSHSLALQAVSYSVFYLMDSSFTFIIFAVKIKIHTNTNSRTVKNLKAPSPPPNLEITHKRKRHEEDNGKQMILVTTVLHYFCHCRCQTETKETFIIKKTRL